MIEYLDKSYFGECKDQIPYGFGYLISENLMYEGFFDEGKRIGLGIEIGIEMEWVYDYYGRF